MRVCLDTRRKCGSLHLDWSGVYDLYLTAVGANENRRVGVALDHAVFENDLVKIACNHQGERLIAFLTTDAHVFEMARDALLLVCPDHARLAQSIHHTVLVGDLAERTVAAPLMQTVVLYANELTHIGEATASDGDVFGRAAELGAKVAIVVKRCLHLVAAVGIGSPAVFFALVREASSVREA